MAYSQPAMQPKTTVTVEVERGQSGGFAWVSCVGCDEQLLIRSCPPAKVGLHAMAKGWRFDRATMSWRCPACAGTA